MRFGIVLTGGGARAAYQVGVVRAMARLGIDVAAISAVGSGSLNGAILAGSATTAGAVERLATMWAQTVLAPKSALRLGPIPVLGLGVYLTMLFGGGVRSRIADGVQAAGMTLADTHARVRAARHPSGSDDPLIDLLHALISSINVSGDEQLGRYLEDELTVAASSPVRPFYVSVYETGDGIIQAVKLGMQGVGLLRAEPVFHEISSSRLSPDDRVRYVLASATLPFLCESTSIQNQRFVDGSFGGMQRSPGAVPLEPLRRRDDLDAVLVVHTESGVTWDASDFPDVPVVEVRPSVHHDDAGVGYFWASADALKDWMSLGERDATERLSQLIAEMSRWSLGDRARDELRRSAERLE